MNKRIEISFGIYISKEKINFLDDQKKVSINSVYNELTLYQWIVNVDSFYEDLPPIVTNCGGNQNICNELNYVSLIERK